MNLRNLYNELNRRHVLRVTGVYLVGAWAVVQVATTIVPLLGWPERISQIVLILVILGLPVTVLLSWFFDLTPEGIRRTADEVVNPDAAPKSTSSSSSGARAAGLVGFGIVIALIGFAALTHNGGRSGANIEAIAVLPFEDLSPNHDQGYFTDGMTEEIMSRLAQAGLRVAARTSAFALKGQNLTADQIAQKLNVQAVLEGSIRRDGDSLRITYTLVDGATQDVILTEALTRKESGVLAIQDEISSAIVDKLKLKLSGADAKKASGRTRSTEAQDLYFKGLQALHEGTDPQARAALDFFEQAVSADSTYALAYAGMAKTYALLPLYGNYNVFDAMSKGKEAAARATRLTPDLGEAYAAIGQISQNLEWDLPTAIQNYRNALRASPNDATAHQWYSEALMMTGDLQGASTEITRALELDPLSAPAKNLRAYQSLLRGDNGQALRLYQNLSRENPKFSFGNLNAAFAALSAHEYGEATPAMLLAFPQSGPDVGAFVAAASGAGDKSVARRMIKNLADSERPPVLALLYAAIGDNAAAIDVLEKSYRTASDATLPYWLLHPLFDSLRSDHRFAEITRGVGIVRQR